MRYILILVVTLSFMINENISMANSGKIEIGLSCNVLVPSENKNEKIDYKKIRNELESSIKDGDLSIENLHRVIRRKYNVKGMKGVRGLDILMIAYIHQQKGLYNPAKKVHVLQQDVKDFIGKIPSFSESQRLSFGESLLDILRKFPHKEEVQNNSKSREINKIINFMGFENRMYEGTARELYIEFIEEMTCLIEIDPEIAIFFVLSNYVDFKDRFVDKSRMWVKETIFDMGKGLNYKIIRHLTDREKTSLKGFDPYAGGFFESIKRIFISYTPGQLLLTDGGYSSATSNRKILKMWKNGKRWDDKAFVKQINHLLDSGKLKEATVDGILSRETFLSKDGREWVLKLIKKDDSYIGSVSNVLQFRSEFFTNEILVNFNIELIKHNRRFLPILNIKLFLEAGGWNNKFLAELLDVYLDVANNFNYSNLIKIIASPDTHNTPQGKKWYEKYKKLARDKKLEKYNYSGDLINDIEFHASEHIIDFFMYQIEIKNTAALNSLISLLPKMFEKGHTFDDPKIRELMDALLTYQDHLLYLPNANLFQLSFVLQAFNNAEQMNWLERYIRHIGDTLKDHMGSKFFYMATKGPSQNNLRFFGEFGIIVG